MSKTAFVPAARACVAAFAPAGASIQMSCSELRLPRCTAARNARAPNPKRVDQ
jgi:hypothetical protein